MLEISETNVVGVAQHTAGDTLVAVVLVIVAAVVIIVPVIAMVAAVIEAVNKYIHPHIFLLGRIDLDAKLRNIHIMKIMIILII